jgi:hypothetical protein
VRRQIIKARKYIWVHWEDASAGEWWDMNFATYPFFFFLEILP